MLCRRGSRLLPGTVIYGPNLPLVSVCRNFDEGVPPRGAGCNIMAPRLGKLGSLVVRIGFDDRAELLAAAPEFTT